METNPDTSKIAQPDDDAISSAPVVSEAERIEVAVTELKRQIEEINTEVKAYASDISRVLNGKDRSFSFPTTHADTQRVMGLCYSQIDLLNELALYSADDLDEITGQLGICNARLNRLDEFDKFCKRNTKAAETETAKVTVESVVGTTKAAAKKAVITNVVPSGEATEDEIRNISKDNTVDEVIQPAEKIVDEPPVETAVAMPELPAPAAPKVSPADPVRPLPTARSVPTAPPADDNELTLDTPDAPIVAGDEGETPDVEVISGPIITDDDDMAISEIDSLESHNIDVIENEEQVDDDPFRYIDSTKSLYNVKINSRSQMNAFLKKMLYANVDKQDVSAIRMFDFNPDDESFRKEYLASRNNMIASPRISRTGLLMSGHFEEVSSYGNWDLASIGRTVTNKSIDFVDREFALYNSIYEHIRYVSYSNNKPEFDEWAKHIYYPDHKSLFFGVYDANSVGKNHYSITCPYCGGDLSITCENKDLAIAIDKAFSEKELEKFITCREIMSTDFSSLYRWARDTVVRKRLNHSKYIIEYRVPTLFDYFTTISTVRKMAKRDKKYIDIESIDDMDSDDAIRILLYMYISKVGLPSPVEGNPNKIKYIGVSEKSDIIELINTFDIDDYSQLLTGKEIQSLMGRQAADYYIENTKCTNEGCGKIIKHIALDPKDTFFFKIGEVMTTLNILS